MYSLDPQPFPASDRRFTHVEQIRSSPSTATLYARWDQLKMKDHRNEPARLASRVGECEPWLSQAESQYELTFLQPEKVALPRGETGLLVLRATGPTVRVCRHRDWRGRLGVFSEDDGEHHRCLDKGRF